VYDDLAVSTVTLEREQLARLDAWCAKHGVKRSEAVRKAVEEMLR
jgi:metal-responsive CopG/Arc/MetJ family transcriptional regulator